MRKMGLLLIMLLLFLLGCKSKENSAIGTALNDDETKIGYVFAYDGTDIAMHAKVAPIIEKLGESKDYLEAESCAFQGMERIYTYNGFELHTYEDEGTDYVSAVIFLDDTVSTKEGICLFSSLDDILKEYGNNYKKNLGQYTYEMGKSRLSFLIEGGEVTSIEYTATAE